MRNGRRQFLCQSAAAITSAAITSGGLPVLAGTQAGNTQAGNCRFGLVTYLWGKDLTLPQLIDVCEQSETLGVELRTTHKHGVERDLSQKQRAEVKARFADSRVTNVGIGSNERYDDPDPEKVKAAIEATQEFITLSRDVGGSGVKVKGDRFHNGVPREKTIEQVGAALHQLGDFGEGHGQEIRLEVHGGFSDLPTHLEIIQAANHKNVRTCWNSNSQDLQGKGLDENFNLVKDYFGHTAHVRELENPNYPFRKLIGMFAALDYNGWILLEARGDVNAGNIVAKLREQRALFDQYKA